MEDNIIFFTQTSNHNLLYNLLYRISLLIFKIIQIIIYD